MITLYQKSTTGKIKVIELWTTGPEFHRRWGQLGGKMQETKKVCIGKNIGKANETTPAAQATLEMEAKVVIYKKEGYSTKMPSKTATIVQAKIDLDNIPEAFCPNKPINKTPDAIVNGKTTYGQRKHDGHCIFLVKGKKTEKVYSRRMEDKTALMLELPVVRELMDKIPVGTFLMTEFVYYMNKTKRETPRIVASTIRVKDAEEALQRYNNFSADGTFSCIPFDVLFYDHKFIGDQDYLDRIATLAGNSIKFPEIHKDWKKLRAKAEHDNWEGFVLRVPGEKSHISYTMDGEAHRAGSYKYKFLKTDDFFVTAWYKGKSGKHAHFYAKFMVAQYDDNGNVIDRGHVGPGKLTHEELQELTTALDTGKVKVNFVVEAEYQDIQDSGKLQFGIIQRLRYDKTAKECIAE